MVRFLRRAFSGGPILAIALITLTALLVHGLAIPRLGYYHDDWYMLWSGGSRGAESLVSLFSMDRPFMGVIYSVFYRMIGLSIAGWHLTALLFRIAGAAAFYWILNLVWPRLRLLSVLAAVLFIVYPGFLAQPNAATKINHLLGYGSALFSIAFTLQAVRAVGRAAKIICIVMSVLLAALYLWIYEYMIGLEVMRAALLLWMLWQGRRGGFIQALKNTVARIIPYVLVIVLFVYWRVFIFESTRPATDLRGLVTDYQTDPLGMLVRLVFQTVVDFFSTTVFAWFVQAYHLLARAEPNGMLAAAATGFGAAVLAAGWFWLARRSQTTANQDEEDAAAGWTAAPYVLVSIGVLTALGAVFPVVASNRHLDLMDAYKGYALHPSAGVMMIMLGILLMLKPRFRIPLIIALITFSAAVQSMNTQRWANYWELQRGFWWQLTWRAPAIQDETLVMAYLPDGYVFQQDYEVWGPINLIYNPQPEHSPPVTAEVLNSGTVMDVIEGRVTDPWVRDIFLPRDFRKTLLLSQPTARSCVRVIDGDMPAYSASERLIVQQVGGYSNAALIQPEGTPPEPPAAVFGREPEHGWCYHFQQASLARQSGDWARIGALHDAAVSAGLRPSDASEYFVFIEGLVNLGREDEARAIVDSAVRENDVLKYRLCRDLDGAPAYPAVFGYQQERIRMVVCE